MSNGAASLPLQSKVSLTLLLAIAAFIGLSYSILRLLVAPAFNDLELQAARSDLIRAEQAIQTDIDNLVAMTADWAPRDDIHDYVRGENPGFRKSNLDRPTLVNLGLDFMAVYALDDKRVWAQLLHNGAEQPVADLGVLEPGDPRSPMLTSHAFVDRDAVGIVQTDLGPALISSQPILRSDDSGPIAGALIMGQFLDDARMARMQARTEVDMRWRVIDVVQGADGERRFDLSDRSISGNALLTDIYGNPLLALRTETPRNISALGAQAVRAALLWLATAGILLTIIIWFLLRRVILNPVAALEAHMDDIRSSGDLSKNLELKRNDEIGRLARRFDELTVEAHDARRALLDQSFKAGKADTAAEVLHNIRNAMTPMINGLDRLSKSFRVASTVRVPEATEQLADEQCPPERRAKLLQYIDASFRHMEEVGSEATEELNIVASQARQIEDILADQERFANVPPVVESIKIDAVVDEAAHIIPKVAESGVSLASDPAIDRFRVKAHRVGLLQVMGNLMLNAYEAIQRANATDGRIELSACEEVIDDKPMVCVTVRDNGCGFDSDTSKRIFQRGYSSKEKGDYKGLGLHWCANAIAAMGGRIVARSDGVGQGAEFHVLLPAVQGGG
jgi:sensor domain CHASE-containing protein